MAGTTGQGGTFTFNGYSAIVTGISVETPVAEVVDMTGAADAKGYAVLAPTGDWTGGSIAVDYIHTPNGADPQSIVSQVGQLSFSCNGYSVSRRCILESASHGVQVGDLVKGTMRFRMTDYQGT